MLLSKQQTLKYKYVFVYYFDNDILNFCRALKESLGYKNFGFTEGRWRFNDLRAVDLIKKKFPSVIIDENMSADIEKYNLEKKLEKIKIKKAHELKKATESELVVENIKGELYPYQKIGVEFFINNDGKAINADSMGCLSGDTEIVINRGGNGKKRLLKDAYKRFNQLDENSLYNWDRKIESKIRSLNEEKGEFTLNNIKKILYKGKKDVIEIIAKSEDKQYKIKLTSDHEVITSNKDWTESGKLKIGDKILVNGKTMKYCDVCKKETEHASYRHAKFYNKCKVCIYKDLRKNGIISEYKNNIFIDKDGYMRVSNNISRHPNFKKQALRLHVLAMEAKINNLETAQWLDIIKNNKFKKTHKFIDCSKYAVHHKDYNKQNNDQNNLELLTHKDHATKESVERDGYLRFKETFLPNEAEVISIKKAGKEDVYDIVMEDPHRNFIANGIVVHNCGKSLQTLAYIAHTKQKKTLIFCPASVKYVWETEVEKWTKLKSFVVNSKDGITLDDINDNDIIIINYDIVKKFFKILVNIKWDCAVLDEFHCFPYKTKILTDKGYIQIGDIVEKKLPVFIASWNLRYNKLEYKKINNYFKNVCPDNLIKIKHQYGEFVCTENHKIWTKKGYIKAKKINSKTELRMLSQEFFNTKEREVNSKILQSSMCGAFCKHTSSNKESSLKQQATDDGETLQTMRKNVFSKKRKLQKKNILFNGLFCKKQSEGSEMEKTTQYNNDWEDGLLERKKKTRYIEKNEKNEQGPRVSQKSNNGEQKMAQRKSIFFETWRKWKVNKTTKIISEDDWSTYRICDKNKGRLWEIRMFASKIFRRFSIPTKKNSDRSRRSNPQNKKMEIFRQKKNKSTKCSRVVSVEVLERGSVGGNRFSSSENKFVYNIEVDDNNNYFAENILVSNCIKNNKAQRTKLTKLLVMNIPHKILLSGTPILSRPVEIYNGLELLDPTNWADWFSFTKKYCGGHYNSFGWDANGSSNISELKEKISRYFIRRTKDQILKDLPPKQYTNVPIKLESKDQSNYDMAEESFIDYLRDVKNKEVSRNSSALKLMKLNELRQITSNGKIKSAISIIEDIINNDEKVVVFSVYNDPLEQIKEHFGEISFLFTGKTTEKEKNRMIKEFQEDDSKKIFLGGIKSAGVGLTLTAASNVVFIDFSWNPADHAQAADRCHRIGTKASCVNIYQLFSKDTVDEFMKDKLSEKQKLFDELIEGKDVSAKKDQLSLVNDIFKEYGNK